MKNFGYNILALHRNKIADIEVKNIPIGQWRYLNKVEIARILKGNNRKKEEYLNKIDKKRKKYSKR